MLIIKFFYHIQVKHIKTIDFLTVIFVNMVANPLYRLVSQWRSHGLRDAAASRCFRTPNHMFSYIEKNIGLDYKLSVKFTVLIKA